MAVRVRNEMGKPLEETIVGLRFTGIGIGFMWWARRFWRTNLGVHPVPVDFGSNNH